MIVAERLDLDRITALFAELGRLTAREIAVRAELVRLLDVPRSPAAESKLGELLRRLGEAP